MLLHNIIVHEIKKEQDNDSEIKYRDRELNVNETSISLIEEVLKIYRKTGKAYGEFNPDIDNYRFSHFLKVHCDGEESFLRFSKRSMPILKDRIDEQNLATGGFVVFAKFTYDDNDHLIVVVLKNIDGHAINENTLEINQVSHLNLDKLHFAAQVDLTRWQSEENLDDYLSFVRGKASRVISQYFKKFIGCEDTVTSKESTESILAVVDNFMSEKLSLEDQEQEDIRGALYSFLNAKRLEMQTIDVEDIASHMFPDSQGEFVEYANTQSQNLRFSNHFEVHRETSTSLIKYKGSDKGVKIEFSRTLLNKRVFVHPDKNQIVISGIPENLNIADDSE